MRCVALAHRFAAEDVQLYYQIALQGRADLGLAPDEYAGFTMTLLRMLAFAPGEAGAEGLSQARAPAAAQPGERFRRTSLRPRSTGSRVGSDRKRDRRLARAREVAASSAAWRACWRTTASSVARRTVACRAERAGGAPASAGQAVSGQLQVALEEHFGAQAAAGRSRSAQQRQDAGGNRATARRQERQTQAIEAIERDPFVRELVENFVAVVADRSADALKRSNSFQ